MTIPTPEPITQPTTRKMPGRTFRQQMLLSSILIALPVILTLFYVLWQITILRRATIEARVQNEQLNLALEIAQQNTMLVVTIQEKIKDRIPATMELEVNALIQALTARQKQLTEISQTLPPGDPIREHAQDANEALQNAIYIAEGTVRHAKDHNWVAAQFRADLLLEEYSTINWHIYQLIANVRSRRIQAEEIAQATMGNILTVSIILGVTALIATGIVSIFAIRTVARQIEQLSRSARRLAAGHFDEQIPILSQDEFGFLAQSLNRMARELHELYTGLEQQVAERTAALDRRSTQLEAAAQVARDAAAIRDVRQLMDTVVRLVSERFGFYHAGLFLLDESGEYAVLQAASSPGGQRMLERGHRLKVGETGIVGYVAGSGEPRIALNVGADAVFFDNPDLPDTRSEMAIPLIVYDRIIGVLDVQSTEASAFTEEDIAILQTMADQVALAIENTRLLEESHYALEELRLFQRQQTREAWRERLANQLAAYRYTGVAIEPASRDRIRDIVPSEIPSRPTVIEGPDGRRLTAPIRLRGETLGTVVFHQTPDEIPWSDDEIAMVEELTAQIGLALENARLLEETQQRAEQERIIANITAQVRTSMNPESILRTAVRELGLALGSDRVFVHLGTSINGNPTSATRPSPSSTDANEPPE